MIESTKPSEFLHDAGTNRLLADIAAATVDVDASAAWAANAVRERLGEPVTIDVYRTRTESRHSGAVTLGWRVSITSADACVFGDSFTVLNEAVAKSCRTFETQRRVNRQMAEVEAADKATRDDGDATTGTLPLVKLGPGGDFITEIRP